MTAVYHKSHTHYWAANANPSSCSSSPACPQQRLGVGLNAAVLGFTEEEVISVLLPANGSLFLCAVCVRDVSTASSPLLVIKAEQVIYHENLRLDELSEHRDDIWDKSAESSVHVSWFMLLQLNRCKQHEGVFLHFLFFSLFARNDIRNHVTRSSWETRVPGPHALICSSGSSYLS